MCRKCWCNFNRQLFLRPGIPTQMDATTMGIEFHSRQEQKIIFSFLKNGKIKREEGEAQQNTHTHKKNPVHNS